jgi:hypothetical protein
MCDVWTPTQINLGAILKMNQSYICDVAAAGHINGSKIGACYDDLTEYMIIDICISQI